MSKPWLQKHYKQFFCLFTFDSSFLILNSFFVIRWYVNLAGTEFPLMTNAEMVDRVTGASHELVRTLSLTTQALCNITLWSGGFIGAGDTIQDFLEHAQTLTGTTKTGGVLVCNNGAILSPKITLFKPLCFALLPSHSYQRLGASPKTPSLTTARRTPSTSGWRRTGLTT